MPVYRKANDTEIRTFYQSCSVNKDSIDLTVTRAGAPVGMWTWGHVHTKSLIADKVQTKIAHYFSWVPEKEDFLTFPACF